MSTHSSNPGPWRCPLCEVVHDGAGDLPIQSMYVDSHLPERECEDCRKEKRKAKTSRKRLSRKDEAFVREFATKAHVFGLTLNEIAVILNMRGYMPRNGSVYTKHSLRNMIKRHSEKSGA